MGSLLKAVRSFTTTKPAPMPPPPVRAAVMVVGKPSAPNADALLLATLRLAAGPVCRETAPGGGWRGGGSGGGGGTGIVELDRLAVDRDGIAGHKAGRQRVAWGRPGQQRCGCDR